MITRIFTAVVPTEYHEEFEEKFKKISVPIVKNSDGLISIEIAGPTKWNPMEFNMISRWENEGNLISFAGEKWNEPHIPVGMEKYISACSLSHFENINLG